MTPVHELADLPSEALRTAAFRLALVILERDGAGTGLYLHDDGRGLEAAPANLARPGEPWGSVVPFPAATGRAP